MPNPKRLVVVLLVSAVALCFLREWMHRSLGTVHAPPANGAASVITGTIILCIVVVFAVGLAVRVRRSIVRGDPRRAREHRAEERFVRHSVRRPADEVPLEERVAAPDEDPTLNKDDEEEDE